MSEIRISPVPDSQLERVFFLIKPELDSVYRKTDLGMVTSPEKVLQYLKEHTMQLWIGTLEDTNQIIGFAITRLDVYSGGKTCTVSMCGAVPDHEYHWNQYIEVIEDWAKNVEHCKLMFIDGRIGWKKVLGESGYKVDSIVLSKVLTHEDHNSASSTVEQIH